VGANEYNEHTTVVANSGVNEQTKVVANEYETVRPMNTANTQQWINEQTTVGANEYNEHTTVVANEYKTVEANEHNEHTTVESMNTQQWGPMNTMNTQQ